MKNNKIILIILILAICLFGIGMFTLNRQPFNRKADRIEIKNGTTGEHVTFEGDIKNEILEKLLNVNSSVSGVALWTSGYQYKVIFVTGNESKEVTIQSSVGFTSNGLKYKVDGDIIKIIEDIIENK
ncbi:hypothetical protein EDC19_2393 [Natranaerovirga hydrolytica]|uniref:Uncharacterized protein n=1 Tax=Natranaerovirga hydrolytica TaxID=680378 RepID=A0A4R1MHL3_9FIRM|nr:hypothetical protein [Natranaerovirga hydrolytica]TCK90624.1 hypothetical protein EDC19_2393 [Natranaerovirga hydrolytica]